MNLITTYDGQTVGGEMLSGLVRQAAGQEIARQRAAMAREAEAREAAHRKEVAELVARLDYAGHRCGQLRAELVDKSEYKYAPIIDRRPTFADRLWGVYGLLILASGAVGDALGVLRERKRGKRHGHHEAGQAKHH